MKKLLLCVTIALFCLQAFAQDDGDNNNGNVFNHYVFKDFTPAVIKKKSGQVSHTPLNYNTVTEEMVFTKDSEKMALTNLEDIDTVYLGTRVFIPVKNNFYEKATNTPVALYIQYKSKLLPPGNNIGLGVTTESSSDASLSRVVGSTQVYNLQLPAGYKLVQHTTYWLYKDGHFVQVNNLKKVQGVFSAKAAAIKDFVTNNNIQFNNPADMAKLVIFCNQP